MKDIKKGFLLAIGWGLGIATLGAIATKIINFCKNDEGENTNEQSV